MLDVAGTWVGVAGQYNSRGLVSLGGYIYHILRLNPAQVVKIDKSTMTTAGLYTGAVGIRYPEKGFTDGTYIYVSLYLAPFKLLKIDPATMTLVDSVDGASGQNYGKACAHDGTYAYVGTATNPAIIQKINLTTMARVPGAVWTGAAGEKYAYDILADGSFLYVAMDSGRVTKIDPATMTTVAQCLTIGSYTCLALADDGTFLYVGQLNNPLYVWKVNKSTMAGVDSYMAASGVKDAEGLCYDGASVFTSSQNTSVSYDDIVKIDPATMTKLDSWGGGSGYNSARPCIFGGSNVYLGFHGTNAKVVKFGAVPVGRSFGTVIG